MSAPWITYLPEIKVMDCTIRDGGLCNDHMFEDGLVKAIYETCIEAGIDAMEIGYKASRKIFSPTKYGKWKFCTEDDIRRIVGDNDSPLELAVMADAGGKCDWRNDIEPREKSVIDIIRVACYVHQLTEAVDMINDAYQKGYQVTCNLMAISTVQESEIDQALELLAQTPACSVFVVDSYGTLNPEQVRLLVDRFRKALDGTGKEVGIHAHNNLQLAFANSIEAVIRGANRVDATMGGLGRGAGNCPMELLLGLLRNPKFRVRPVWQLLQDHFVELRQKIEWGPLPPYMITGQLNQHPRAAIAWLASEDRDRYADFYDRCLSET